jgi:hypothetical protein
VLSLTDKITRIKKYHQWRIILNGSMQAVIAHVFNKKVAGLKTLRGGRYGASYLSTGI